VNQLLQFLNLALRLAQDYRAAIRGDHANSAGIVSAVFKFTQSRDQNRDCLSLADIADNPAHILNSFNVKT